MKFLTKSAFTFSLKTALAAFLALYLALELNLEKPTWSLTTVYVVSQIYSASTVSKSFFRLLGTVLGGIFIFVIYPATVMSPRDDGNFSVIECCLFNIFMANDRSLLIKITFKV